MPWYETTGHERYVYSRLRSRPERIFLDLDRGAYFLKRVTPIPAIRRY